MSKRARGKFERFVALRYWLLKSPAWRSLPANARAIYVEIAACYNGSNNGGISYSVRQAAEALHISKPTACRMLRLLQDRGFIQCTKRGAFSRKTVREASEWCLTEYHSNYPVAHATKDFMHWQPREN